MKSLIEVVNLTINHLKESGISNPKREGEDLISLALGLKRLDLYLQHDRPLTESEIAKVRSYLQRRSKGEPLAYVHGSIEFLGLTIQVNKNVLIPRVETELWVSEIDGQKKVIWDICCGSGAIGLSLKNRFPESDVVLSDISKEALDVAKLNMTNNHLRAEIREGDLFTPFKGETCDLMVINPPYISDADYHKLDLEVKAFEPKLALTSGATGLEFYERIAIEAPKYLNPRGELVLEIGYDQEESVKSLFDPAKWTDVKLKRDLSGHPRCLSLKL